MCYIFRLPRPMNFKLGTRMEDDDLQAPWPPRTRSQSHVISLSRISSMANKSKTNSRSITKIGKRVPPWHVLHCAPVSRSKVRVTGLIMQMHKMCQIFRTVRPKNFKVDVRMEDVDRHQRQAPWPPRLKGCIWRVTDATLMDVCIIALYRRPCHTPTDIMQWNITLSVRLISASS